jgi:hypothetical protein
MNKDNPAAFPRPYSARQRMDYINFRDQEGMTLRDYFAAAAMRGMIMSGSGIGAEWPLVARKAYAAADAMLAERNK